MTYETAIRKSGWNKQVFETAQHSNLWDAAKWIIERLPAAHLKEGRFDSSGEKYGSIIKREGQGGIVTSHVAFYQ